MDRFKRTFSFKKKKSHVPEASKPHQWQEDEKKVRDGTCSFQVRYLGCIEVFDSRGIQVCEEAVKALKSRKERSVWSRMSLRKKKTPDQQCKGKYQRAILHVSGDALRVTDEISKGLIVDQTIEKVSFCAPDRNHEKGFAYICRDGTTRRWMCHGFLAVKESGERLSHAVGCAFAICLEKKQKREKEAVEVTYNEKGTSFTRMGSFRQATLTERMADPQSTIIPEPVQATSSGIDSTNGAAVAAIQRPHASEDMLQRQASFRGFSKLSDNSPFKRNFSLRPGQLPSTLERKQQLNSMGQTFPPLGGGISGPAVDTIDEVSPSKEQDDLSQLCQQIQSFAGASNVPDVFSQPVGGAQAQKPVTQTNARIPLSHVHKSTTGAAAVNLQKTAVPGQNIPAPTSTTNALTGVQPIQQTNPWATPPAFRKHSLADSWLESSAMQANMSSTTTPTSTAVSAGYMNGRGEGHSRAPALGQLRSQTVDMGWVNRTQAVVHAPPSQPAIPPRPVPHNGMPSTNPWAHQMLGPTSLDPFDAQWATKSAGGLKPSQGVAGNPFQASSEGMSQTFKLQL